MSETNSRTLTKNTIKNFILKIDLVNNSKIDMNSLAQELSKHFDRTERQQINVFDIDIKESNAKINNSLFNYILVCEGSPLKVNISESLEAIWLESNQYTNSSLYKEKIKLIVETIKEQKIEINAKRIGLRYINDFSNAKNTGIGKIFNKRLSEIVRTMLVGNLQSRIIGLEEYNDNGYKIRLQYGIPNRFYPRNISTYDLVLDIDSYYDSLIPIDEWEPMIKELNHRAYEIFSKEINQNRIEELK